MRDRRRWRGLYLVVGWGMIGLLTLPAIPHQSAVAATPTVRLSAASGDIGRTLTVFYEGFAKNRSVRITWDGATIATATTSVVGDGSTKITVPNGVKGPHKVKVIGGNFSASAIFSIRPQIRMSPATVVVNQTVSVSFRGYAAGEVVNVTIDSSTKVIVAVTMSATGNGSTRFAVPPTIGGSHKFYGKSGGGSSDSVSFRVVPSITLNPASGGPGANIRAHLRGFQSGERVELQWRSVDQTSSLGFATASATGSVNVTFTVPRRATSGAYGVIGRGYGVSVAETPFQVT